MAKHEIIHPAGRRTPEDLRSLLCRYFSEKEIARIERLGGRVTITLTTPYNPPVKGGASGDIEITDKFVTDLESFAIGPQTSGPDLVSYP